MTCVGIIANPASGKDIRRLVAHGSVFSNHEKVNIVRRILIGLDAMGIDRVVTMPDAFDICRRAQGGATLSVTVQELKMPTQFSQQDTTQAVTRMQESGVDCMITLGGDGTNRAVAKAASTIPVLPVSTGTNNVFPYMIEGTLAGMAAGIAAQGLVDAPDAITQRPQLDIEVNGEIVDLALVDAVICDQQSVASRAIWDVATVRMVVVAQRLSARIGFMALAGNIPQSAEGDDSGLIIETHTGTPTVLVPIAPGLVVPVGVRRYAPLEIGGQVEVPAGACTIALDGERERKIRQRERLVIRLNANGPRVVNPHQILAYAAQQGVFLQGF